MRHARPVLYLRSLLFWCGFFTSTLVFAPLSLLTFPFKYPQRYAFISQWSRFNLWWLQLTCGLRYRIEGLDRLTTGNAIVMAKHQSTWETLALQRWFIPQVWVLKQELLRVPLFGWGLAMLRPIAIDRSAGRKAVKQVIDQGKERLASGAWVVIFPEGTRTAVGQKGRYGLGGALLAEYSGYPIVPVAHNAGVYWPRHSFIKYPGEIEVVVGTPIPSQDRKASELIAEVEEWIEGQVAGMAQAP